FMVPGGSTPAADPGVLSVSDECQQALGYAARTDADRAWLQACVHALSVPTGEPTPTLPPLPSARPTPKPTTTQPPPPPPTSTHPSGPCPVAGKNVPGAADPWGGCWPGPGNTGVPANVALVAYTGPCTITTAGTVIDGKKVTCDTLSIQAANVVIRNSLL